MSAYTNDYYTYFAQDGSYGDAKGIEVFDTLLWKESDWEEITDARDYERVAIAQRINDRIRNGESK